MLVLIDGCNVLHVEGVLPPELAGLEAADLASLISESRYRLDEVLIVMDGPRGERGTRGGVQIIHSGPGRTADEVIIEMVRRSSTPRSILVVSSDREIRREATRRRSKTLSSEAFLAQLGRDGLAMRPGGPSPRPANETESSPSTERWIEAFGVTEADLVLPPEADGSGAGTSGTIDAPPPDRGGDPPAVEPTSDSQPVEPPESRGPKRPKRALEDVRSLDEIDPRELERFDMGEWMDGGS